MELICKKRVLGWRVSKLGTLVTWQNESPKMENPYCHIGSENLWTKNSFSFSCLAGAAPLIASWGEVAKRNQPRTGMLLLIKSLALARPKLLLRC